MELLSIHVGRPRLVQRNGQTISTAIYKHSVEGPIAVRKLGLEGDDQADKQAHGGPDKAVYAYSAENYRWWREQLQEIQLPAGTFGENLTVSEMTDDQVCVGDIYRIGTSELQVTQPRQPCMKLGVKMNMPTFVKRFHQVGRVGFYLRVLKEGTIAVGDRIRLIHQSTPRMSVQEIYQLRFSPATASDFRQAASLDGLSAAWQSDFRQLAEHV